MFYRQGMEKHYHKMRNDKQGQEIFRYTCLILWFGLHVNTYCKTVVFENVEAIVYAKDESINEVMDSGKIHQCLRAIKKTLMYAGNVRCLSEKKAVEKDKIDITMFASLDSITMSFVSKGWSFDLDRHTGIIKSFYIDNSLRKQEGKINVKDCNLRTKIDAKNRAKNFLVNFLKLYNKKNEISAYDSSVVNDNGEIFQVNIIASIKNDIYDSRYATIDLAKQTGVIMKYRGIIQSKYDIKYNPKIGKNEAIKLIKKELKSKTIKNYHIREIMLVKERINGNPLWMWSIYFCLDEKCTDGSRTVMIDSETGEIVLSDL